MLIRKEEGKRKMKEKIIEAYKNLADKLPEMGYEDKVRVIIKMRRGAFYELLSENKGHDFVENRVELPLVFQLKDYPDVSIVRLYGIQTPIIVVDDIPEDIDFVMQLKEDYVRIAFQELSNKLNKMFGGE